jgi:hypothetical protein
MSEPALLMTKTVCGGLVPAQAEGCKWQAGYMYENLFCVLGTPSPTGIY